MPLRLFPIDEDLAQRLRQRRTSLGWSQNKLAREAGLTEAIVSKYETLRSPLAPDTKAVIEAALVRGERARA